MAHCSRGARRRVQVLRGQMAAGVAASVPTKKYNATEWATRCELAAGYHIAHQQGWDQHVFNHITAKVPGSDDAPNGPHFLINPFGLKFHEVYASSLLKVDIDGNVLDEGDARGPLFRQGYVVHSGVHRARPDLHWVVHNHHNDVAAVGMTREGLLPLTQEAMSLYGRVSYHPFEGTATSLEERERIAAALGPHNKVLILQNHGPVTAGATAAEAFILMATLTRACEYQTKALAIVGGDLSRLAIPSDATLCEAAQRAQAMTKANGKSYDVAEKFWNAMVREIEATDGAANIYR